MYRNPGSKFVNIHWKKKDSIALFLIISIGFIFTVVGFFYVTFYNIFFSTCLGLFFGGLILSIISTFLAQMESNITGAGEIDAEMDLDVDAEVDVDVDADVDVEIDTDIELDIDTDVDVDYDVGAEIEIEGIEVDAEVDVEVEVDIDSDLDIDTDIEAEADSGIISTVTPAPIMLLLSTFFLIFGISGILLYYTIIEALRFIILFITPILAYITSKVINFGWKKLAKSRYYNISSTKNLIGTKGEVLLRVDERGGVIKVPSNTPLRFERVHVKPVVSTSSFERGEIVYICDVNSGYLLVDSNKNLIRKRRS